MSSTLGNNYVGPVGPNGVAVWRPTVTPTTDIQSMQGNTATTGTSPPVSDGGQGTTKDPDGNVFAAALYFAATCKAADAVGNTVRADTTANSVTTVTCYQPYPCIGVIIKKSSATSCIVQTYGLCNNVMSGLTANDRYFAGPTGAPSLSSQLPQDAAYVQAMGFAVQPGVLFIQPTGVFVRRYTATSNSTPPPGQQAGAAAPGDTLQSAGGRILHGEGTPDPALGEEDDEYLQTDGANGFVLWGPKSSDGWGSAGLALVGAAGPAGSDGPVGAIGPQGERGERGEQGLAGEPGPVGATGSQGPIGPTGLPGQNGKDGADGQNGSDGPAGANGKDGKDGSNGVDGQPGPQGEMGSVGPAGAPGPAGDDGTRWFVGDGPPDPQNSYPDGSFYFDRQADKVYPPAA